MGLSVPFAWKFKKVLTGVGENPYLVATISS